MRIHFYGSVSRTISFVSAGLASILILLMPYAFTSINNTVNHGLLMTLMFGTMIGFIHAVGFKPETFVLNKLLHPLLGWLLIIVSVLSLFITTG